MSTSTPGPDASATSTTPSESTPPTPSSDAPAASAPDHTDEQDAPADTSTTPGRDLAVMPAGSLDERIRYANALATAGDLIPAGLRDGRNANPGKVLLAVETGAMLGVHPVAAINGVNIIDGKATLSPALMSGLVRRAGHKLRVKSVGTVEAGDISVTATLVRSDDTEYPFTATWTPHRAARAGLCTYAEKGGRWAVTARSNSGKALPWEAYTEALLKARAIGEVCREGAEDVLMGVHYTPEELGATVNADGEMVESTVVSITPAGPAEPTAEQVAEQAVARAKAMPDVASVVGVWKALPEKVAAHSWARGYADLMDYAKRTVVAHPYGAVDRPTLLEAFGIIRTRLEGGGDATPPAAPPAPTPPAGDVVDAELEAAPSAPRPAEEVHDAEVVQDDPWADGTAQAGRGLPEEQPSPHDAATMYAMQAFGAEVVSEERGTPAQIRRATHEAEQAEARREAAETAGRPAPGDGAGGAALAAARAKIETDKAARRAADAAGASKGRARA